MCVRERESLRYIDRYIDRKNRGREKPTLDLVPLPVAELELVVRLEDGADRSPPVVHHEL